MKEGLESLKLTKYIENKRFIGEQQVTNLINWCKWMGGIIRRKYCLEVQMSGSCGAR